MKLRAALLVQAATLLSTQSALADKVARLAYSRGTGAEHCAGQTELERAVEGRLGENPFDPAATRTFRVEVLADGEKLVGLVTLIDEKGIPEGLRRFEGDREHCDELLSALSLGVSLAINPDLAIDPGRHSIAAGVTAPNDDEHGSPEPAAPNAPPATDTDRGERAGAKSAQAQNARVWVFSLGADAHVAMGTGPAPSPGFVVLGRARYQRVSLALEGRFDAPLDHAVEGGVVYSTLAGASLVPCFHAGPFQGCAVGLFANVSAGSQGVDVPLGDHGLYVGAGVRLGGAMPLSGAVAIEVRGDALMSIKPVAIILNEEPVWTAPLVSGALGAAVVVDLP